MPEKRRLEGIELIDCVRASVGQSRQAVLTQCGYGDMESMQAALKNACHEMGVELSDLITNLENLEQSSDSGDIHIF